MFQYRQWLALLRNLHLPDDQSSPTLPASELDKMDTSTTSQGQVSTSTTTSTDSQNDLDNTFTSEQPCDRNADSVLLGLQRSLSLPNSSWMDVSRQPLTSICLCKVSALPTVSTQPIVITHCLTVSEDLTWELYVHNRQVQPHICPALQSVPQILTSDSLNKLLQLLDRLNVCCGQPDSHFISMVKAKKGKIISCDGKVAATIDQYAPVAVNGEHHQATVQTGSCEMVTTFQKCTSCKSYRGTLRAMYNRWCKRHTCDSNERYLSTPEKKAKMSKLKDRVRVAEKEVQNLRSKIKELTQQQGDDVDARPARNNE